MAKRGSEHRTISQTWEPNVVHVFFLFFWWGTAECAGRRAEALEFDISMMYYNLFAKDWDTARRQGSESVKIYPPPPFQNIYVLGKLRSLSLPPAHSAGPFPKLGCKRLSGLKFRIVIGCWTFVSQFLAFPHHRLSTFFLHRFVIDFIGDRFGRNFCNLRNPPEKYGHFDLLNERNKYICLKYSKVVPWKCQTKYDAVSFAFWQINYKQMDFGGIAKKSKKNRNIES